MPSDRLVEAAFAGLQDSAPRSAVLALYARLHGVTPSAWERREFVQVWGPRGAVYVVPRDDVGVFTVGRFPRNPRYRAAVEASAERVRAAYRLRQETGSENLLRGAPSLLQDLRRASRAGLLRIRWDGSKTDWWMVDPPRGDAEFARLELARRFLRSLGPSTPAGFAWWAGETLSEARETFQGLAAELVEVDLDGKTTFILEDDRAALRKASTVASTRLLPPGDPYLGAADRSLLIPDARLRNELWPKSVWPGALLVNGELVGTWRRRQGQVAVRAWRILIPKIREAVQREVRAMPLGSHGKAVRWSRL